VILSKLPPRERQIVDILFEAGPLTAAEVGDHLPDQLSGSAIRAMLKRRYSIVPGFMNWLTALFTNLTPDPVNAAVTYQAMKN